MQMDFWMGLFSGAIFGAGFMWIGTRGKPTQQCAADQPAIRAVPLLDLLARHLDNWPTGYGRVIQDEDGTVWACAGLGSRALFVLTEIATDRATTVVTEAKWKAQRAQAQQKGPAS
ncbi:MAG: hypothetical protein LBJ40_22795 [Delftia acidovorans]|nr:hypothetical protein [Delftia acidovorans]